ncbi:MAG: deoxyhypusine synthase family protein [Candidatus Lokiarchaeota archaeon]|nr:deoxyhypusine synthase family protein [Candidatus Lokiarchaeota archaeon]
MIVANRELKDYLDTKVVPFDPTKVKDVKDILHDLKYCGFQGRNLGIALDILYKMVVNKKCLTVLTLSGAMVPAGMGELVCLLMEHQLIDVLVTTGANISHDLVDSVSNIGHYLGSQHVDDDELYKLKINRIYDLFLPEDNYIRAEEELLEIVNKCYPDKKVNIAPSAFLKLVGQNLKTRCILSVAARKNIPIFVPAFSDSEFALDLIKYTVRNGFDINFKILEDVKIFAEIVKEYEECGTFIIGGGVPRNWAQQIFPYLDAVENLRDKGINTGYNYSVRIHTATEYDGGLSGCTISESKSWGKYALDSNAISVWCDATIAFPILVTGLFQRLNISANST